MTTQSETLGGVVLNENGNPVSGAHVYYLGAEDYSGDLPGTVSESGMMQGFFTLPFIPNALGIITHIGYDDFLFNTGPNLTDPATGVDQFIEAQLNPAAYELDPIIITPENESAGNGNLILLGLAAFLLLNS